MKKFFILILLLVSCNFAQASQNIFVFHINGMYTTYAEARNNKDALEETAQIKSNIISSNGHFDLLYNKEDESAYCVLCNQLNDILKQKALEHKGVTIDDYVVAYMKANHLNYESGSSDYENLKQGIKDDYLKDPAFVGANLDNLYSQFRDKIQQDAKFKYIAEYLRDNSSIDSLPYILFIPHSQGNLYANELYEFVTKTNFLPSDHIAIYGMASPASKMDGVVDPAQSLIGEKDPSDLIHYITADNDFIINSLRTFSWIKPATDSPMVANVHLNTCSYVSTCHNLIGAYLADSIMGKQIAKQINLFIISLKTLLIKNGIGTQNVKFAYQLLPAQSGMVQPNIISPSKKDLCNENNCDLEKLKFLNTNYPHYDLFDQNLILFKSDSEVGDYLLTAPNKPSLVSSGAFAGNIVSAYLNTILYDGQTYKAQYVPIPGAPIDGVNYISFSNATPATDLSGKIPDAYYNNQFILGKFSLN